MSFKLGVLLRPNERFMHLSTYLAYNPIGRALKLLAEEDHISAEEFTKLKDMVWSDSDEIYKLAKTIIEEKWKIHKHNNWRN